MSDWFFVFHKIIPLVVMPVGVTLILISWGAVARRRGPVIAAGLVLWASAAPVTSETLLWHLENRHPGAPPGDLPSTVDAVVVLGGIYDRQRAGGKGDWNGTVDRFEMGLELYRSEAAPLLVFSGAGKPSDGGPGEGEILRRFAIGRDIPGDHILVTDYAVNTAAEAVVVSKLMKQRGWKRVLLATSALHMPRAILLFESQGVEAIPAPADFQAGLCALGQGGATAACLIPDAAGLHQTQNVLRELLGYGYYWLRIRLA